MIKLETDEWSQVQRPKRQGALRSLLPIRENEPFLSLPLFRAQDLQAVTSHAGLDVFIPEPGVVTVVFLMIYYGFICFILLGWGGGTKFSNGKIAKPSCGQVSITGTESSVICCLLYTKTFSASK